MKSKSQTAAQSDIARLATSAPTVTDTDRARANDAPSHRLRVLHITESTVAGVETHILQILEHIDRDRFECSLICPPGTSLSENASRLGATLFPIELGRAISPVRDTRALLCLYKIMRTHAFDVVHTHSSKAGFLGRLAAFMRRGQGTLYTPNAFYYIGRSGWQKRMFLALEKVARAWTDCLIATSDSEADRALKEVGYVPDAVRLIYNSISADPPPRESSRVSPNEVLFAGRLSFQKNPEMFVRASAIVLTLKPDTRFVVIGFVDGEPYSERIRHMIADYNLTDSYDLLGWMDRDEMLNRVSECSLVVVPSRYESFGYVAAEAMNHRKPVVATKVDGLRDVVAQGTTGYLVALDDDQQMAHHIVQLLENPDLRETMGRNGAQRVADKFNMEINVKLLEDAYLSVARMRDQEAR